MSMFKPATSSNRLWLGLYGPEGAGKSHTAINIAVATKLALGLEGPIAVIDTENAFGFHAARVKSATGQDLMVAGTRDLKEVETAIGEAIKGGCSILIIDSLTHVLRQARLDWCERKGKSLDQMQPQDYGASDARFKRLVDRLVTQQLNIILCGRQGTVYGRYKNKRGEWKEGPVGTKFNAGEAGYEVDVLIELGRDPKKDGSFDRTAVVRKDRSDTLPKGVIHVPWRASEVFSGFFGYLKGDTAESDGEA
ncbi:MAG: AAA family ATPase [Bacteroidota bacterium]